MSAIPLLLTAGTPEIDRQVLRARTAPESSWLWNFEQFFVCWINPAGLRLNCPQHWTQQHSRLGCIAIDTAPYRAQRDDNCEPYRSYVIFRAEAWADAWQVARLLAGSNRHRPATVRNAGLTGRIFVVVGVAHHLITREDL